METVDLIFFSAWAIVSLLLTVALVITEPPPGKTPAIALMMFSVLIGYLAATVASNVATRIEDQDMSLVPPLIISGIVLTSLVVAIGLRKIKRG